jgi:hypothetical protein
VSRADAYAPTPAGLAAAELIEIVEREEVPELGDP